MIENSMLAGRDGRVGNFDGHYLWKYVRSLTKALVANTYRVKARRMLGQLVSKAKTVLFA